jgi:hypothetical protein
MDEEQQGGSGVDGELAAVRDVVLQAHPDVVPELVAGSTIAELLASVEPARAAYARISERMRPAAAAPPPAVPAGSTASVVDPATLPAHEMIRRGIEAARR